MSFNCGRKLEYLEETPTDMGRMQKLCTEGPQLAMRFEPMFLV